MKDSYSILVVDSNATDRKVLSGQLGRIIPSVEQADSIPNALEIFWRVQPNIVFVRVSDDEYLGSADNNEVLLALITSGEKLDLLRQSLSTGASTRISFPIEQDALAAKLARLASLAVRGLYREFSDGSIAAGRMSFELESCAQVVGPTVQLIVSLLRGFAEGVQLKRVELALDEAIRNAYEHGNLGISNGEKSELLSVDGLEAELARREVKARQEGKKIRVSVEITDGVFSCSVEDDGAGFDWQKRFEDKTQEPVDLTSLNGRGILLMRQIFDSVTYNEKGNKLTVVRALPF